MDTERWNRLQALLEGALELPPGERPAFLDRAAEGDADLVREAAEMVAAHDEMGDFLEWSWAGGGGTPEPGPLPVARLGPYRLLKEIGRGGMGAVYLALRDDDEYEKLVSIKLIRRGMDTDEVLRRFRQERQILARLEHGNIAKLLDGGTSEDGRSYFVLEYVEGEPIDRYCRARDLSVEKRLELFQDVCAAVSYAHRSLVVHRDLKPGNILVTTDTVPKLLDFGVAKLLTPLPGEADPRSTHTGLGVGTPRYASPEQLRGGPITTATDVYSLGVILYELLTERSPFRAGDGRSLLRRNDDEEPVRPSRAVLGARPVPGEEGPPSSPERTASGGASRSSQRLRRRLAGDLDNVVLKALRADPARRYASVEQLSEDIRRHLAGLPVAATPDSLRYRAGKLVRRNKLAFVAGTALASSLVVGIGGTSWMAVQSARSERRARAAQGLAETSGASAERARSEAESARRRTEGALERAERARLEAERSRREVTRESDRVRTINRFLANTLASADPHGYGAGDSDIKVREVLDQAARRIEEDFAEEPDLAASVHDTLGLTYMGLGVLDAAARHLRTALELRRRHLGEEHPDFATSLIHVYHDLFLELIWVGDRLERRDYDQAVAMLKVAARIRQRRLGPEHDQTTEVLSYLSNLQRIAGDPLAEDTLMSALAAAYGAGGMSPEEAARLVQQRLATVRLRWSRGDVEGTLGMIRAEIEPFSRNPVYGLLMWDALCTFAESRALQGDFEAAEPLYEAGIRYGGELLGPDHPDVARCHWDLAHLFRARVDLVTAARHYRRASEIYGQRLGPELPRTLGATNDLAVTLLELGDPKQAESLLSEALGAARRARPGGDRHTGLLHGNYGRVLMETQRLAAAEGELRAAYADLRDHLGALDVATGVAASYLERLGELRRGTAARGLKPLLTTTSQRYFDR